MTSTDIGPHFLGECGKDKLRLAKTFQHQNNICYTKTAAIKPVCIVRPNDTMVAPTKVTRAEPLNGSTCDVAKLPVEGSKLGVVKLTSKTSSRDTQNQINEMTMRKNRRDRKRKTLVRVAGYTAWAMAPPLMILLLAVRTPAVDAEDLYDDPLLPWKYGRRPPAQTVK